MAIGGLVAVSDRRYRIRSQESEDRSSESVREAEIATASPDDLIRHASVSQLSCPDI